MLVLVASVVAVGVWVSPERGVVNDDVALPTEVADSSPSPFVATPSATVVCSDLSEHRIDYARLNDADVGDTVEVHGGTCVLVSIDADARPRLYPRGVARGGRPGSRPEPSP